MPNVFSPEPTTSVNPSHQSLEALAALGTTGPIAMLNVLRYATGSGRSTYGEYAAVAAETIAAVGGSLLSLGSEEPVHRRGVERMKSGPDSWLACGVPLVSDDAWTTLRALRAFPVSDQQDQSDGRQELVFLTDASPQTLAVKG